MLTILKGFTVIIVVGLLSLLLFIVFSAKTLIILGMLMLFFMFCYLIGLLIEDIFD